MYAPGFALILLIIPGCATPRQRAIRQQNIGWMIAVYGWACEKPGFQGRTGIWRNCVLQSSAKMIVGTAEKVRA
jgi:hypothetical protein